LKVAGLDGCAGQMGKCLIFYIGPDLHGKPFSPPLGHFRHPDEKSLGLPLWASVSAYQAGSMAYCTSVPKHSLAPQ